MAEKLIERLRVRVGIATSIGDALHFEEAANALEAQQARIRKLEEALKPIVDVAKSCVGTDCENWSVWEHPCADDIYMGDLRRAAKLLEGKETKSPPYQAQGGNDDQAS